MDDSNLKSFGRGFDSRHLHQNHALSDFVLTMPMGMFQDLTGDVGKEDNPRGNNSCKKVKLNINANDSDFDVAMAA